MSTVSSWSCAELSQRRVVGAESAAPTCLISFRNTSMQDYGLDTAHYFSAPGKSWDALLKMTKVEFELLTDIGMHLFT